MSIPLTISTHSDHGPIQPFHSPCPKTRFPGEINAYLFDVANLAGPISLYQGFNVLPTQTVEEQPSSELPRAAEIPSPRGGDGPSTLPSLTGLRWSAALLVFLYHISVVQYFGGHSAMLADWAFDAGNVGVSFFFVLSGFVLAWSAPPTSRTVRFWRKRFARIYPLHLTTALLALLLAFTLAPSTKPDFAELVSNLSLTQSWVPNVDFYQSMNPVSWSLACETFFYFLFPFLIGPLRRLTVRGNSIIVIGCIAFEFLVPAVADHLHPAGGPGFLLYFFVLDRLPEFLLGMALAQIVVAGRWRGPGLAASLAITTFGYFLTARVSSDYRYEACTVIGITCLIAAVALADVRGEPSPWRSPRAVKLGELSFAFYMIHLLVMRTGEYVFRPHPQEGWFYGSMATVAAFTISLTAAWVLHDYVEKPMRRLILSTPVSRRRPKPDDAAPPRAA
jgi:peptidoglycan/LPS O-acetylase OafA/YrhL